MTRENLSPKVLAHAWGEINVEGFGLFKDVKLFPGGAKAWDWRETGTQHSPGVQIADAEELIEHGARIIILTQGVLGVLKTPAETISGLEARGLTVHTAITPKAIELYNQLRLENPVGILIHSTC